MCFITKKVIRFSASTNFPVGNTFPQNRSCQNEGILNTYGKMNMIFLNFTLLRFSWEPISTQNFRQLNGAWFSLLLLQMQLSTSKSSKKIYENSRANLVQSHKKRRYPFPICTAAKARQSRVLIIIQGHRFRAMKMESCGRKWT